MIDTPSIVAWSSKEELDKLKSWFYDPQPSPFPGESPRDLRQRAIQRVRGPLKFMLISGSSVPDSLNQFTLGNRLYSAFNTGSAAPFFISTTRVSH